MSTVAAPELCSLHHLRTTFSRRASFYKQRVQELTAEGHGQITGGITAMANELDQCVRDIETEISICQREEA